jgi:hypothetical protein
VEWHAPRKRLDALASSLRRGPACQAAAAVASGVVVAMRSLARTTLRAAAEGTTGVEADTTSSSTGAAVEGVVAADAVGVDRNRTG